MKIPEKIKGRNKLRDAKIILLWDRDELETNVLAEKFNLSQRRIEQILRDNHAFVPIDKEWEKKKRIRWLKLQIQRLPQTKKDPADLIEQLRNEIEGAKASQTQVNVFPSKTIVFKDIDDSEPRDSRLHEPQSTEGFRGEGTI